MDAYNLIEVRETKEEEAIMITLSFTISLITVKIVMTVIVIGGAITSYWRPNRIINLIWFIVTVIWVWLP